MNELMKIITERRSYRKYKPEQISKEELNTIMLAGAYAPSAGGRQSPVFVACQNAELNEEIGQLNVEILKEVQAELNKSDDPKNRLEPPKFKSAFYGAPTVVTFFAPKGWYNFAVDCCVAAQNMALAAHTLGIGSCIIARAPEVFATKRGLELQHEWGLDDTYDAKLHLLLGYPDGEAAEAPPRRDGQVIVID
jgi:nitroreductase